MLKNFSPTFIATIFATGTVLVPYARAGGGWVGNSPMLTTMRLAQYSQMNSSVMSADSAATDDAEKTLNALLLGPKRARIAIGIGGDESYIQSFAGFDYGLSKNWTLLNLTTVGYNLWGNGGHGHEWVLLGGLGDGTSLAFSPFRLFTSPILSVIHTWSSPTGLFRITTPFSLSGCFSKVPGEPADYRWKILFARIQPSVSFKVGESWSLGGSIAPQIASYRFLEQDESGAFLPIVRKTFTRVGWTATLSHQLDASSRLDLIVGDSVDTLNGGIFIRRGGFFSLSHEW